MFLLLYNLLENIKIDNLNSVIDILKKIANNYNRFFTNCVNPGENNSYYTFYNRTKLVFEKIYKVANSYEFLKTDVKLYEDYNSIGLGGQYDLGIASLKLGYYTESEFDVDYLTFGGGIDAGIVDISLAYYYNTDSFFNETLMISFGFDL